MEETTVLKAITDYFNNATAENHKPLREFAIEIKALSADEKRELGTLAAAAMGKTVKAA